MRVIKIDVEQKDVYELDIEKSLESYYKTIGNGCELIETATILPSKDKSGYGDVVYVDEECFLRVGYIKGFFCVNGEGTFANNGIVVGSVLTHDDGVDTADCTWDLNTIRDLITFHEQP